MKSRVAPYVAKTKMEPHIEVCRKKDLDGQDSGHEIHGY
jgi:hypothetical protein